MTNTTQLGKYVAQFLVYRIFDSLESPNVFSFFKRNQDPYRDLLRSSRRTYRQKTRFLKRLALILFFVLTLGSAILYHYDFFELPQWQSQESKRVDAYKSVLISAKSTLHHSIKLALIPTAVQSRDGSQPPARIDDRVKFVMGTPTLLRGTLKKNQSLINELVERNIDAARIHAPVAAIGKRFNFRYARPGDKWEAEISSEGDILSLKYQTSPEDIYFASRDQDNNYTSEKLVVPLETLTKTLTGTVSDSLWNSLEGAGTPAPIAVAFLDIFAYVVDFHSVKQEGDTFAIIYESIYLDGQFLRTGKLLAARYISSEQAYDAFFDATVANDKGEYYDANGQGMQGKFLKSPLSSVRITSKFGKRFHPVLGRMKQHNGVDYGAATGTPVQVVADGVVTWAKRKGPNGLLVTVKHDNGYTTHYAHLSRILVKKGAKVKKKDIIGKVGSTGRSTGPHLHFGMSKRGRFVDPLKVKFDRIDSLSGNHRQDFINKVVDPMTQQLNQLLPLTPGPSS